MKTNNILECRRSCGSAGVIIGIILGVIVAVLFSLGLTPLILNGIWTALGLSGAVLVYVMALAAVSSFGGASNVLRECLIRNIRCLLTGIFGSIISALILVSISLEISSIVVSVIVGLLALFLTMLIASLVSFLRCLIFR